MPRARLALAFAMTLCALALPARAVAEIRVLSATGDAGERVAIDGVSLLGWTDDGTAMLGLRHGEALRLPLSGSSSRVPVLDTASRIGPGGGSETSRDYPARVTVRSGDGRVIASFAPADISFQRISDVAWAPAGTRAAILVDDALVVFEADSGATIATVPVPGNEWSRSLSAQAFSPDGLALVVRDGQQVLRVDATTGTTTVVGDLPADHWEAPMWSASGAVAVPGANRVWLIGAPVRAVPLENRIDVMAWSPDGSRLTYTRWASVPRCADDRAILGTTQPGAPPRELLATAARIGTWAWSPDGEQIAVSLGGDPDRRGRRHPWPHSIARKYEMIGRAGDAEVRAAVVRAVMGLRQGAGRSTTMRRIRVGLDRVYRRHPEVEDTAVQEAIAAQLNAWLQAAGFARITSSDELDC